MRLQSLCALALTASEASAFLDTSPFFMFSTSDLLQSTPRLQTSASLTSELTQTLSLCPSDYYILISQPGVTTDDYTTRRTHSTLSSHLSSKANTHIRSSVSIPSVLGAVDISAVISSLTQSCNVNTLNIDATSGSIPSSSSYTTLHRAISLSLSLPSQSQHQREADLSDNDALIASLLEMLPTRNFTVLYITSPHISTPDGSSYNMDTSQDSLHMDLKRDLSSLANSSSNGTLINGPLFHRYQFLTPGIFMGFFVGFILIMILYVGISALSSLSVTYAAFDKEQGQLAGKKMQ